MAITTVFDIFNPDTDSPTVIETKSLAFANNLVTFSSELNTVVTAMNFNATNSTSSTSWTIAASGTQTFAIETGKSYVPGMTVKVAATSNPIKWALGDVISASSGLLEVTFREMSAGGGTFSDWTISQNASNIDLQSEIKFRSSSNTIYAASHSWFVDCVANTQTQSFSAVSNLGDGWWIDIRNSGSGDVTLDPNGSETIDGRTTIVMYPGEARRVFCDGTSLYTMILNPFFKRITSSGSIAIPPGYKRFGLRLWSGGGSGQRTNSTGTLSRGGGGGGCIEVELDASLFGTSQTATIGAGGLAVTTVGNGNVGGDTSFGSLAAVYAGNQWHTGGSVLDGLVEAATNGKEAVYAGASGTIVSPIDSIWGGSASSIDASADSSDSVFGAAAGGSVNASAVVRAPGTSVFGGNGGAASSASNGTAGVEPGGGGGATQTGTSSGAGAKGRIEFWGIA